jgi:hypothetical protein
MSPAQETFDQAPEADTPYSRVMKNVDALDAPGRLTVLHR